MNTADFAFSQAGLFVIPIEDLSPAGVSDAFAREITTRTTLGHLWIDLFNVAFATYWDRATLLAARAPQHWFPPRVQHVCVVTNPAAVRPYFQPFHRTSWLLYASDFDPATSNRELATYQMLHVERMSLSQQVVPTLAANLSYFLVRTESEIAAFRAGCQRCVRPDASAFVALANAMPWLTTLHHETLRPMPAIAPELRLTVPNTGLIVPRSRERDLGQLVQAWSAAAQRVAQSHFASHAERRRDHAPELAAWLATQQPQLLITHASGDVAWDPQAPHDTTAVTNVLRPITDDAAQSMLADWHVIDRVSRTFLDALVNPHELRRPHAATSQDGLSYMHRARRLIAYNVNEGRMQRLREPAPPFERCMLAARTFHEWAHLAVDSGWIGVPGARQLAASTERESLAKQLDHLVAAQPERIRNLTASEHRRLQAAHPSVGHALAAIACSRLPDYQANLLGQSFLAPAEMQSYVRNNVASLVHAYTAAQLFVQLARYVFEYQYLRLAHVREPLRYFASSTFFADQYLRTGVVTMAQWDELVATMARLCDCYAVDWQQIRKPEPAP